MSEEKPNSSVMQQQAEVANQRENCKSDQMASLLEISHTSDRSAQSAQSEVERIVKKTLEEMQATCHFSDVNTLMSLVMPKVLYEMHAFDQLHEDVQNIKQSLHSYTQHSRVLGEDIAEIFLDLHNIYSKLEKLDNRQEKRRQDDKFNKRLKEAEQLLLSNKHYINNDDNHVAVNLMATSQEDVNDGNRLTNSATNKD